MATRCAQCGVAAPIADHHPDHGDLCSLCASRQAERDRPGCGLAPGMFGFTGDDADRWDDDTDDIKAVEPIGGV